MADFIGVALFGDALYPFGPVAQPSTGVVVGEWLDGIDQYGHLSGSFGDESPAERLTNTFPGVFSFSFFDDYYNRIWLIPQVADFGPVVSDTSFNIFLWNAHINSVTLETIDRDIEDTSISITGLTAGVTEVAAIAGIYFSVDATGDGDPSISLTYEFTFDPSEVIHLPVLGVRSKLWAFSPNWDAGYKMTLEYMTEIITAYDGTEQRRMLRQTPRKGVEFETIVHDGVFRQFLRYMASWQQHGTMMPEFGRPSKITTAIGIGDTFLPMTAPAWINVGDIVTIHSGRPSSNVSTVRTVGSIDETGIVVTAPVDRAWPSGSRVYPTLTGRLNQQIGVDQKTNKTAVLTVKFDADPGLEPTRSEGEAVETYDGRELFLKKPNWKGGISPQFQGVIETLDYGVGRISHTNPVEFNIRLNQANYLGKTIPEVDAMEQFFRRQKGRLGEFFMPTYTEDLVMKGSVSIGGITLRFEGLDVFQDYEGDLVFQDIIVLMNDGTYQARHIQEITTVDDEAGHDTIMQITEEWTAGFSTASIRMICWLPLWRFASDSLTVEWVTSTVAQMAFSMLTLPYVEAEE